MKNAFYSPPPHLPTAKWKFGYSGTIALQVNDVDCCIDLLHEFFKSSI